MTVQVGGRGEAGLEGRLRPEDASPPSIQTMCQARPRPPSACSAPCFWRWATSLHPTASRRETRSRCVGRDARPPAASLSAAVNACVCPLSTHPPSQPHPPPQLFRDVVSNKLTAVRLPGAGSVAPAASTAGAKPAPKLPRSASNANAEEYAEAVEAAAATNSLPGERWLQARGAGAGRAGRGEHAVGKQLRASYSIEASPSLTGLLFHLTNCAARQPAGPRRSQGAQGRPQGRRRRRWQGPQALPRHL